MYVRTISSKCDRLRSSRNTNTGFTLEYLNLRFSRNYLLFIVCHNLAICIFHSAGKQPTFHVIREVYDSSNAHERFEAELDKALEAKVDFIIIEPPRLGDETGMWTWLQIKYLTIT